ncbi:hypothetical protein SAMN05216245_1056 [Succiniclasticum ruminis DSM 9236]|uniref:Uncharacterized protein n=1 Tax=Succiniclasticum ruminis DSM 9236 TaxID=1123323 RepID=A0A1I2A1H4_9FIRM|nr:hypothetical protein SAMN05216245_1056 [Succiniclasticum ruminis DSM 9236]
MKRKFAVKYLTMRGKYYRKKFCCDNELLTEKTI